MGVNGLYSLVKKYGIHTEMQFRDSKLVIDGNNLVYSLYFQSKLDQNHGGEYLAFRAHVQAFFKKLADREVKPYVLLDGADIGVDRLETIMKRTKQKYKRAHEAAVEGTSMGILPIHTWLVFEQTLSDMGVPQAKCYCEADRQVAALAREWCCPVLSQDSDFYIFNLQHGVLHLDHFWWDSDESYIPCKLYTTSLFCEHFNIQPEFLPIFASLAENTKLFHLENGSQMSRLQRLLTWLPNFQTIEDTLTAAMKLVPYGNREEKHTKVRGAMLEYNIPESSSLLGFFNNGITPPLPDEIPIWVSQLMVSGALSGNILLNKRKILVTQVEDSNLESSSLTSRPVRQALYGLLLGQEQEGVTEWVRDGLELTSTVVRPMVPEAALDLRLDSLPEEDPAVRLRVCLETMGVEEQWLNGVPAPLLLPVAVTCYWLKWANPEPNLNHLKALLMVMVQGELGRRAGSITGWQGDSLQILQPPDPGVAHSFNQWQACLQDATLLNELLCKPLLEPHMAWLYQGRLVHRRVEQLQLEVEQLQPEVEQLQPEVEQLQQEVHSAVFRELYSKLLGATQFVRQERSSS